MLQLIIVLSTPLFVLVFAFCEKRCDLIVYCEAFYKCLPLIIDNRDVFKKKNLILIVNQSIYA